MKPNWNAIRRWLWRAAQLAAVVAVVGGIIYRLNLAPITVDEHQVRRGPIVAEVLGTGTLEARIKTTVSPKISGRVKTVLVDQGDRVSTGEALVQLDDDELRQQVAIAQANLDAAVAALERLKTDKMRATAVATQASKHHTRAVRLAESSATSQHDVDKAVEALAVADAALSRAEAAITEGQKELIAAEKTLDYHRARLADTTIIAPFDGLIVRRHRDPGDVVVPGTAILTLISTEELWVRAWVDETEMAKLRANQVARVVFRSEPNQSYSGRVVRLGREADRETREFIVDVRVQDLPQNWAVGQRAEVYIKTAMADDTVIVPAKFVSLQDGHSGVFVNNAGRAEWRRAEGGIQNGDTVEIVKGIQVNDRVVMPADPQTQLTNGRRIATR